MIKYQLSCDHGHSFEAWFSSIATFEAQQADGKVVCPECASTACDRQPMAPAIAKRRTTSRGSDVAAKPLAAHTGPATPPANWQHMAEQLRAFKEQVIKNSEDVGSAFAEEARKIHYGESPERGIRGEASLDDAKALSDEGIDFGLLPKLPEDHN